MSLNYDLQNVKADWKSDDVWPITNALIWGTMSVGMNSITEANWQEFYTRAYMIQTIYGGWISDDGQIRFVTPQEIREHIGLGTNANNLSNAKFKENMDRRMREQAQQIMRSVENRELA